MEIKTEPGMTVNRKHTMEHVHLHHPKQVSATLPHCIPQTISKNPNQPICKHLQNKSIQTTSHVLHSTKLIKAFQNKPASKEILLMLVLPPLQTRVCSSPTCTMSCPCLSSIMVSCIHFSFPISGRPKNKLKKAFQHPQHLE